MKVVSIGFPKTLFPFRSISQRMNLEYDEIDEVMDALFEEIFEKPLVEVADLPDVRMASEKHAA